MMGNKQNLFIYEFDSKTVVHANKFEMVVIIYSYCGNCFYLTMRFTNYNENFAQLFDYVLIQC